MRVLFIDGTPNHDPHQRTSKPTGGILNSLTLIPEYLVKQGHEVYVTSKHEKLEDINGVRYILADTPIEKWDVTVFNRNVLPNDFVNYCKGIGSKVIWWLHDIVQLSYLKDDTFKQVDKIVALSDYCKNTYSDFYSIPKDKFKVIPNGVDSKLFYPGKWEERNPHLFITASAAVKGTMPLVCTLQNLKRADYNIDFRVYTSQKLHGLPDTPAHEDFLRTIEREGAHVYAPVSPEVLAHLMRKAWVLLMPNSYPEICSNLLIQARASGCPVVTSNIGSAPEFIEHGKTGLFTSKYQPHDLYSWIVEYANLVMDLQSDHKLHKHISDNSPNGVMNWEQVGEAWNELLKDVVG